MVTLKEIHRFSLGDCMIQNVNGNSNDIFSININVKRYHTWNKKSCEQFRLDYMTRTIYHGGKLNISTSQSDLQHQNFHLLKD